MSANRARRIHEIPNRVTTVDLSGQTDLLVLDRLAAGVWDNAAIFTSDLYSQLSTAILSQISSSSIASELTFKDGLALEFFEDYAVGARTSFDKGYGWGANGVGSGTSIVQRTGFGNTSPAQKRLVINSGQYGRQFAWGDSWNRIQIAVLWRLNSAVTFNNSAFYFGVNSGTAAMAADAGTLNFIGMRGPNNGVGDATFNAGTRVNFFDINPSVRFVTKRGASPTDLGSGSGSNGRHVSATEGFLSLFLIEISRPTFATDGTSVTYSLGRQMTNLTQVEMSLSKHTLVEVLEGQDFGSTLASGSGLAQIASGGLAGVVASVSFDQSTGKLDTFNFTWDKAFDCEIAALGARKLW
jgi:hypothetical protein